MPIECKSTVSHASGACLLALLTTTISLPHTTCVRVIWTRESRRLTRVRGHGVVHDVPSLSLSQILDSFGRMIVSDVVNDLLDVEFVLCKQLRPSL